MLPHLSLAFYVSGLGRVNRAPTVEPEIPACWLRPQPVIKPKIPLPQPCPGSTESRRQPRRPIATRSATEGGLVAQRVVSHATAFQDFRRERN